MSPKELILYYGDTGYFSLPTKLFELFSLCLHLGSPSSGPQEK